MNLPKLLVFSICWVMLAASPAFTGRPISSGDSDAVEQVRRFWKIYVVALENYYGVPQDWISYYKSHGYGMTERDTERFLFWQHARETVGAILDRYPPLPTPGARPGGCIAITKVQGIHKCLFWLP